MASYRYRIGNGRFQPLKVRVALILAVALAFAIWEVSMRQDPALSGFGAFLRNALATGVGFLGAAIGGLLGEAFRTFGQPQAGYTRDGGARIIVVRLFWMMGPPLIGMFFGTDFMLDIWLGNNSSP